MAYSDRHRSDSTHRRQSLIVRSVEKRFLTISLLIATGAGPLLPEIPGIDLPGVFTLHTMDDSFAVHRRLMEANPRSAIIVGAGYIGVEMADALVHRGLQVTLVGKTKSVLATVDPELGDIIGDELRRHKVEVRTNVEVTGIESSNCLRVSGTNGFEQSADLVLVAAGVKPASHLALQAGISTGQKGAIQVDTSMRTNIPDIYAAGDCVETWHEFCNNTSICRSERHRTNKDELRERMR